MTQEVSESGAPIFRYTNGEEEFKLAFGEECIEEISNHIEKYVGPVDMVYHELLSDTVHIDIHYVKPSKNRPFHILITSGMSDLPMSVPEGSGINPFNELMITLPEYWQVSEEAFKDPKWYWPIAQLKFMARFPHKYKTYLSIGHTMPNGDPAEPYASNTKLSGMMLMPSAFAPDDFFELKINDEKTIYFYSLIPLYSEEMDFKLKHGAQALGDKLDAAQVYDVFDVKRKNVCKKRFWLF